MKTWLRRIRGSLGMGLVWSVPWAIAMAGIVVVVNWLLFSGPSDWSRAVALGARAGAVYGFISGALFGGFLSIAERRSTIDSLSTWRVGFLGSLAALLVPMGAIAATVPRFEPEILVPMAIVAGLGSASAAGALKIARAGPQTAHALGEHEATSAPEVASGRP